MVDEEVEEDKESKGLKKLRGAATFVVKAVEANEVDGT